MQLLVILNNRIRIVGIKGSTPLCLKPGGKLALIELFFEKGSKTQEYLAEQGKIWASCEAFVRFCESAGFTFIGSETVTTRKGPVSDGDLYPLDQEDCSSEQTVYFEKTE